MDDSDKRYLLSQVSGSSACQDVSADSSKTARRAILDDYFAGGYELHAEIARDRANAEVMPQADQDAWQAATNADTADAYAHYLQEFPAGAHSDVCRSRYLAKTRLTARLRERVLGWLGR